ALDRKDEVVRRRVMPGGEAFRPLQRVESPVDLDAGEVERGIGQLVLLSQAVGIEFHPRGRIASAGDAKTDLCNLISQCAKAASTEPGNRASVPSHYPMVFP